MANNYQELLPLSQAEQKVPIELLWVSVLKLHRQILRPCEHRVPSRAWRRVQMRTEHGLLPCQTVAKRGVEISHEDHGPVPGSLLHHILQFVKRVEATVLVCVVTKILVRKVGHNKCQKPATDP